MALSAGWVQTISGAETDPRWQAYDTLMRNEVATYNRRFALTPGYVAVDWRWIKAMLWVESGGPDSTAWTERPLQIGNPGDPGLQTLEKGAEGSNLIMSDELSGLIRSCVMPQYAAQVNIRAGIAYLFTRMAITDFRSVPDTHDSRTYTHSVGKGETFSSIAKTEGTTLEELRAANPSITSNNLRVGATLQFHHAQSKRQIIGWRKFDSKTIAARYNGGGDVNYAAKLDYVMKILQEPAQPEAAGSATATPSSQPPIPFPLH